MGGCEGGLCSCPCQNQFKTIEVRRVLPSEVTSAGLHILSGSGLRFKTGLKGMQYLFFFLEPGRFDGINSKIIHQLNECANPSKRKT